jgi:hypothetical protein
MFDGKKYKWTQPYHIEPRTSNTIREARDKTYEKWKELKNSGDPKYSNWELQKGREDNVILLTFVEEGPYITRDGEQTDEILPIYNNMLNEYEPDIKHISDIENKVNTLSHLGNANLMSYQSRIYSHYIYIANVYRNLKINGLVDEFKLNIIRMHYNYLSKFIHPSKYSIKFWTDLNTPTSSTDSGENKRALKELVLLYCVKLMQLYFGVFISGYKDTKHTNKYENFKSLVEELSKISRDFWFFDNEPLKFDLDYSENIKKTRRAMGKTVPVEIIYNENPLDRLIKLRNTI